jgi:hypothetical protein
MSNFEGKQSPRSQFESVRAQLERAVDDVELINYAMSTGPLMLSDILSSRYDAIQPVVEELGWPDENDSDIAPVKDYIDTEFIEQLFSTKTPEEDERALNNFRLYLRARPISDPREAAGDLENMYGLNPFVHRANALSPDLFSALRTSMNAFEMSESKLARYQLLRSENSEIRTAYHMGYRIMGRLVKKDDLSTPISDAHQALTD